MIFHVGQKVTPKNSDPWDADDEVVPIYEEVYTISRIELYCCGSFLAFCEISNPPRFYEDEYGEMVFNAIEFRPVVTKSTSIEVFRRMLEPSHEKEPA
jgi:hypothetical protein